MVIEYNTVTRLRRWTRTGRWIVQNSPDDTFVILCSECIWIVPGTITE